ncbi:MAG: hypothetical protein D6820_07530, partial [Lentisphaerae bacterium]
MVKKVQPLIMWKSIAPISPANLWRARFLAMKRVLLREPIPMAGPENSNWQEKEHSSSMKSVTCRRKFNPSCCGCSKTERFT